MSIEVLPNEIIMFIMRRFALQERILLRAVSSRWKLVIEDMCHKKQTLMLLQDINGHLYDDYDYDHFDYNYLVLKPYGYDQDDDLVLGKFSAFNEASCQLLASLFPYLNRFVLQLSQTDNRIASPMLYYLLENCLPKSLQSLSLIGDITYLSKELPQFTLRICNAINSMKSLKHLDLFANDMFPHCLPDIDISKWLDIKPSRDLRETLPRLEHFAFTGERTEDVADILPKLGSCCTSLELQFNIWFLLADFRRAVQSNGHLANLSQLRLHQLEHDINYYDTAMPKVNFVCETFTNLRSLFLDFSTVEVYQMSFNQELFENLAKLAHLADLTLKYVQLDNEGLDLLQDDIVDGNCPQIYNVKCLVLRELFCHIVDNEDDEAEDASYDDDFGEEDGEEFIEDNEDTVDGELFCKTLAFIFPKLELLTIRNYFNNLSQFGKRFVAQINESVHHFEHLRVRTNFIKSRHDPIFFGRHSEGRL